MPLHSVLLALASVATVASAAPARAAAPIAWSSRGDSVPARAAAPARDYWLYVVAESADQVALVRFGPDGAKLEKSFRIGLMPTELNGPHGVSVSPDGRYYYVTVSHGTPFGTLWKFSTVGDTLLGRVTLGHYPASVGVSPDGALAFVANFNVYGEMVPSSVSIVSTAEMVEIARPVTCTMPHGSRLNAKGTKHYSTCMMDDMLVEIDARALGVARHFMLGAGKEMGMDGPVQQGHAGHAAAAKPDSAGAPKHDAAMSMPATSCSPTWAAPSPDDAKVYVACNKSNDIVEVDVATWTLGRRIRAGNGVYNLAVSPDGKWIVATNKRGQSVSVIDRASGRELAQVPTKRKVLHGVVISPDSRYAFVTVEGVGSEPGTIEMIDLATRSTVQTLDIGQQAAGIDFLRMGPLATPAPAR